MLGFGLCCYGLCIVPSLFLGEILATEVLAVHLIEKTLILMMEDKQHTNLQIPLTHTEEVYLEEGLLNSSGI
jgi:hypothetical protein